VFSWVLLAKKSSTPGNNQFYIPNKGFDWPPEFVDLVDLKDLEAAFQQIKLSGKELKFCAGNPDGSPPDEQECVGQTQEEHTTVISLVEKVGLIWAKVARVR
jgi:hypothetical protein